MVKSIKDGLDRLNDEKILFYISIPQFTHLYNQNLNQIQYPITLFGEKSFNFYALILTKN